MKTCEACGKELIKRDNELEKVYLKRRFCNRSCVQLPMRLKAQEKYKEIIESGLFTDLLTMTIKEVAKKHNISPVTVAWIMRSYKFNRQEARSKETKKRNDEIRKKFKSGFSSVKLSQDYKLSPNTISQILQGLERKHPFALPIGMEPKSLGAIWDVEINVKPHYSKYSFFSTNTIWNT